VLGAGGHGKVVVSILQASGQPVAGVLDDYPENLERSVQGVPVIGRFDDLALYPDHRAIIAVGDNMARMAVAGRFPFARWGQALYSGAYVNPSAKIGEGTVLSPGTIIAADTVVGAHVIVSGNSAVGHDCVLEDFAHVAPGTNIGGNARIGKAAMLGLGSIVCPGVRIGVGATLGAGAVAVRDIPDGSTAFGIPARPVRTE
jgi:acetyltransferase EpsM